MHEVNNYCEELFLFLDESGIYTDDTFLDKNITELMVREKSIELYKAGNDPRLTEEELMAVFAKARSVTIDDTLSGLIGRGVINITSIDEDGEFFVNLNMDNQETKDFIKVLNENKEEE